MADSTTQSRQGGSERAALESFENAARAASLPRSEIPTPPAPGPGISFPRPAIFGLLIACVIGVGIVVFVASRAGTRSATPTVNRTAPAAVQPTADTEPGAPPQPEKATSATQGADHASRASRKRQTAAPLPNDSKYGNAVVVTKEGKAPKLVERQ